MVRQEKTCLSYLITRFWVNINNADCVMVKHLTYLIVGFMGSGKSTLLQELSSISKFPNHQFIDLDNLIEESELKTISEIIAGSGMSYFRDLEIKYLENLLQENGKPRFISLGGGAFNDQSDKLFSKDKNLKIIWVNTDLNICIDRIRAEGEKRPLNRLSDEELSALHQERLKFYRKANFIYKGDTEELIAKITSSTIE